MCRVHTERRQLSGVQNNTAGEPMGPVYLTDEEFSELILLIDDDPVDEELLGGIRKKLVAKRKRLRKEINDESSSS